MDTYPYMCRTGDVWARIPPEGGRNRCESKEAEKARAAEMQQARESWAAAAGAEMNTELPQHL